MEHLTHSAAETEALGCRLGCALTPARSSPTGRAGHGQDRLHPWFGRGLDCRDRVTSPTFTIVNEYQGRIPLFHFDMYRLPDADALFDIGWEDYLDRGGVCAVEWSENVAEALPEDTVWVDLRRLEGEDNGRRITITG